MTPSLVGLVAGVLLCLALVVALAPNSGAGIVLVTPVAALIFAGVGWSLGKLYRRFAPHPGRD